MAKTRYSIREARQDLSELGNRIRYGAEMVDELRVKGIDI